MPQVLDEAPLQDAPDVSRHRGRQPSPVHLPLEDAGNRVGHRVGGKRCSARQHLVEHAAERPDVGAFVDELAARLLRAHVRRGAQNYALQRHRR
ncbi:MAG TPA: hypothetical protein VLD67_01160 [Vicinamibacterales bacterium]|nr:hypothetical protein [Vicinamibacterales bacterium]